MSEWLETTVGEATCFQQAGGTPTVTNPEYYGGEIPFVAIEDITNSARYLDQAEKRLSAKGLMNSAAWLLKKPYVLYSMYATVGKPVINRINCATNQAIIALEPAEHIDLHFLYYQLLRIRPSVYKYTSQTTQSNLNAGTVKKLEFVYPKDKNLQKKIVQILTTIDEAIEQTEALIGKYEQIKAGMMHDLFTRGLTADGQLRPSRDQAPDLYKETPIGWIPKEWCLPNLEDICGHVITYGIVQAGPDIEGGIPYIRTGDMSGNSLVKDNLLRTSKLIADSYKRSEVKSGEIVCAIRATVGKVLVVPNELDGANLTQGTARISPKEEVYTPFVLWGFRSHAVQKNILLSIKGTTFNEITLGDLRKLHFPIPASMREQQLIADRLEVCELKLSGERRKKIKLENEKQGLMHDLLTGKVPVTVDEGESSNV
jgi:type I restriction enzyme S subunit